MRFLTLSGIGWLLSLAGLCCWLLIVICALRILLPHVWSNLKMIVPSYAPKLLKYAAGLGFLGLSFFAGYGYRDHQLTTRTFEYDGVSVLSQQSDRRYGLLIPGYSREWDFEFCHALKMPSNLIDIKYEQRNGCKQVYGIGFVKIHKENQQNAQLQVR